MYWAVHLWHDEVIKHWSKYAPPHCVMCQLLKHPMGQLWFCSEQLAVLCELCSQLLITECRFGDVPLLSKTNVWGGLLFKTVGCHRELFFGKPFICDKLSVNPCQILQSINVTWKMELMFTWGRKCVCESICTYAHAKKALSHLKPMELATKLYFWGRDWHFLYFSFFIFSHSVHKCKIFASASSKLPEVRGSRLSSV